jgi:hypothetical protein
VLVHIQANDRFQLGDDAFQLLLWRHDWIRPLPQPLGNIGQPVLDFGLPIQREHFA